MKVRNLAESFALPITICLIFGFSCTQDFPDLSGLEISTDAAEHPEGCPEFRACDLDCPDGSQQVQHEESWTIECSGTDALHGPRVVWWNRGSKRSEQTWIDGRLDGTVIERDKNGQRVAEFQMKAGLAAGEAALFFDNGEPYMRLKFEHGFAHGLVEIWHKEGQQRLRGEFRLGLKDGRIDEWYPDGQKRSTTHWKLDVAEGGECRDKEGRSLPCWHLEPTVIKVELPGDQFEVISIDLGEIQELPESIEHIVQSDFDSDPGVKLIRTSCPSFEKCNLDCPQGSEERWERERPSPASMLGNMGDRRDLHGLALGTMSQGGKADDKPAAEPAKKSAVASHYCSQDGRLHGSSVAWYASGIPFGVKHWKAGLQQGRSVQFHDTGTLHSVVYWKGGVQHGPAVFWFKDGTLEQTSDWKDGKSHGLETSYFPSGTLRSKATWQNGGMHGTLASWYPDGTKELEAHYENNKRQGNQKLWSENGSLSFEATWKDDGLDGEATHFYTSGKKKAVAEYVGGKKHGSFVRWHENGQKSMEGRWSDDARTGRWSYWNPDGSPDPYGFCRTMDTCHFDCPAGTDLRTGPLKGGGEAVFCEGPGDPTGGYVVFYPDGALKSQATFDNGSPSGEWTQWYPSGSLLSKTQWSADGKSSSTTNWYESGEKRSTSATVDGKEHGRTTFWYKSGKKMMQGQFRRGEVRSGKCWNKRGRSTSCQNIDTRKLLAE
jgi:antitoxin component YwqK of YwqJK toxin-antitoxin module